MRTIIMPVYIIIFYAAISAVVGCPSNCRVCDQSSPNVCRACDEEYQLDVYGKCLSNSISQCSIYGLNNQQCYGCQPTYRLQLNRCIRDFSGCIKIGRKQACFQCSFGLSLINQKCQGVINCLKYDSNDSSKCQICSQGYSWNSGKCVNNQKQCLIVRQQDGLCSQCNNGYKLNGYRCILDSYRVKSCYIFGTESQTCLICKNGYKIYNKKCYLSQQIVKIEAQKTLKQLPILPIIIQNCEVIDKLSNKCNKCISRYYLSADKTICKQVSPLCYTYKQADGQCLTCNNEAVLYNGQCFIENCRKTIGSYCQQCYPQYLLIENKTKCFLYTPDQNCENWSNNKCLKCKVGSYLVQSTNSCLKFAIIQNCVVYNSDHKQCINCSQGYYADNSKCTRVSYLCKQYDTKTGHCIACKFTGYVLQDNNGECYDKNCASPLPINSNTLQAITMLPLCIQCKQGYLYSPSLKICTYYDQNCLTSIVSGCLLCDEQFYRDYQNKCKLLPLNCEKAYPDGKCNACKKDYELVNSVCGKTIVAVSQTIKSNYLATGLIGCQIIDQKTQQCIQCWSGFYLRTGQCFQIPASCDDFNSKYGLCIVCKPGFITRAGSCLKTNSPVSNITVNNLNMTQNITTTTIATSTITTSTINKLRSDDNCIEYSVNNQCKKCKAKYYYSRQLNKCTQVNPLCQESNQFGHCTQCYRGYVIYNNGCQIEFNVLKSEASLRKDPNCKIVNNDLTATKNTKKCLQCLNGYFYSQQQSQCLLIDPLCKQANLFNGKCLSCFKGYKLTLNSRCLLFIKDPLCLQYSQQSICLRCVNRYYYRKDSEKCLQVSQLCKTYDNENGGCTTCFNGYILLTSGICSPQTKDELCQIFKQAGCSKCYEGYFINIFGKCEKVDPLCKDYNKTNGYCTVCYQGYTLSIKGRCQIVSVRTIETVIDIQCRQFDKINQKLCIQCYTGYIAIKGKCSLHNLICKTVDMNTGQCLSCWPGYTLVKGNCSIPNSQPSLSSPSSIQNDPNCKQYTNFICSECAPNFKYSQTQQKCIAYNPSCSQTDQITGLCLSCFSGYIVQRGVCVSVVTQSIADSYCLEIKIQTGQCLSCISGYYLADNRSQNGIKSICQPIPISCAKWNTQAKLCQLCLPNYYLQNNQCILPAIFDQNCMLYENYYCSKCKHGFYLKEYGCLQVDPDCFFFDYPRQICYRCLNGKTAQQDRCI